MTVSPDQARTSTVVTPVTPSVGTKRAIVQDVYGEAEDVPRVAFDRPTIGDEVLVRVWTRWD